MNDFFDKFFDEFFDTFFSVVVGVELLDGSPFALTYVQDVEAW